MELFELRTVLKHRKEFIEISDTTDYQLCRVQTNRKGVVLRETKSGSLIGTKKQQICKTDDFIVAEMDAKVGGYGFIPASLNGAIVSSHYFLFEVNFEKIRKEYLEAIIQTEILQEQIQAKGSTNYSAIRPKDVLLWKIPLASLEQQKDIESEFLKAKNASECILSEIQTQKSLLSQLKQSILQEAIQGKLTEDWRKQHPGNETASELLKRIKAEKAKLIKEGKIKKENPLPPITKEEIPFELPEGWVWCRMGEIATIGTGGTPLTSNKEYYEGGKIPWVTSSSTNNLFVIEPEQFITEKAIKETNCKVYPTGTLIVAMYGQGKTRGQITELKFEAATNQACATISPFLEELHHRRFIKLFFQKIYLEIRELAQGGAQPNLNMGKIKNTKIPIPPLAEQVAIVQKVETLMEKCRALEAEIAQSEQHAQMLMQAVLKEAFEPKKGEV